MKKFSILLASRERISLLHGLLDSLINTTENKNSIEVLVTFDTDDKESTSQILSLESIYRAIGLRCFVRHRSEWMHRDYINWMFPNSTGKYLLVLNDDTQFTNMGWDIYAYNKLEMYLADKPDGVVYGYTDNSGYTTPGSIQFSCFPLVSRKTAEILGFVMPNERKTWGGDSDICNILRMVDRTLDVTEIKIKHISYHTGLRERDDVSHNIERIFNEQNVRVPLDKYATVLSNYIITYRKGEK